MDDRDDISQHRQKVQAVFNQVVPYYDTMNDLLSFGLHRYWKKYFIQSISLSNPQIILDLSTGTGDLLIALLKKYPSAHALAVDPDPQMLRYAQLKVAQASLERPQIEYIQSCAEELHLHKIRDCDLLTCSFGLRNMSDIAKSLENMHLALKPGGLLRILEFAPNPASFQKLYKLYRSQYLPFIGKILFNDPQSYEYLAESIEKFHSPSHVRELLIAAGFHSVSSVPYSQGIVYQYEAYA